MDDKELVEGCLKGDIIAQKRLYLTYAPKMKGICLRYAANEEEAEDILQEAFIRIYTKMHMYKFTGPLGAWIRRVVVNTAAEIYRKVKKTRNQADIDTYSNFLPVSDDILESLAAQDIMEKVHKLPDGYRVVFNFYAVEGYTHREIGEALNISENTSKSQYCRARAMLRKMIEEELELYRAKVG